MNKQTCYILVGLSASGKSSVAEALAKFHNADLVSSDVIRGELSFVEDQSRNEEVFNIFHKRIRDGLNAGRSVIADATNITIKSRKQIIDIAKRIPNVEIVCVLMATPWETCVERDKKRNRSVSEEVLRRQLMKFQIPFYEEGFDDIVVVRTMPQDYDTGGWLGDIREQMENFDQKNPHHEHLLGEHCDRVFYKFSEIEAYLKYSHGALFHDMGKLKTQTIDDKGVAHYYNHENVGAYRYFIDRAYDNNCFSIRGRALLDNTFLINYHMMPFTWKEPKTVEKYKKIFGEEKTEMLIYFNECDRSCSQ
jgi:predicted kinase